MDIFLSSTQINTEAKSFCLQLFEFVLTNNLFLFDDQMYSQGRGTAMGSNVAPPYANIFMSVFEDEHLYPHDLFSQHALIWLRYINDIFCIWSGPVDTLLAFHQYLNSIDPELQFTLHYDPHQIQFLDMVDIKKMQMDTYTLISRYRTTKGYKG